MSTFDLSDLSPRNQRIFLAGVRGGDGPDRIDQILLALASEEGRSQQFSDLTDEALHEMEQDLLAHMRSVREGEVDGIERDDIEHLKAVAAGVEAVRDEAARRIESAEADAEAAAEREAEAAAILDELTAQDEGDGEGEGDGDAEGEGEAEEAPAEAPAEEAPAEEAPAEAAAEPPVAASTQTPERTARRARAKASLAELHQSRSEQARPPVVTNVNPRWQLRDGTQKDFADKIELSKRIIAARSEIAHTAEGMVDKVTVASLKVDRPAEMEIREGDDIGATMSKIDAATAPARDPGSWTPEQQALVASGGWAAPPEARYTIPNIASAARPFRDSLVQMGSSRGAVSFVRAARLSTILSNVANAAVTTWENSTDVTPGGSTKTRQTMVARTIQQEDLGAVVSRVRFGNFQARAFPEDVAHDLDLVAARHARVAEVRLMDALISDVNIDITQTGFMGTARDVKHHFTQAASEMRWSERTQAMVRAAISDVLIDAMVADIAMQQASGELDALLADENTARAILRSVRGLATTEVLDVPSGTETFLPNADNENLADFPDNYEIPFFYDGTVVFVDGGELNVGIVRDSTLNNTNDYELFYETFEGLLWLGPYAKTLTLTTCPNGFSQLPQSVTTICSGS